MTNKGWEVWGKILYALFVGALLFLGAKWFGNLLEGCLKSEIAYANAYAELNASKDVVEHCRNAHFLDKYLVFWNDNAMMPDYLMAMGRAYSNMDEYAKAKKAFEKALKEFERYKPQSESSKALCHAHIAMICSTLNEKTETLSHAKSAGEYYESHLDQEDQRTASTALIWLANAYYNDAQYENAKKYFELSIPLFYDTIEWGMGDETAAKMIAILYKVVASTYEKLGDEEHFKEYSEKYEEFTWFRDFEEEDLEKMLESFHWMNR